MPTEENDSRKVFLSPLAAVMVVITAMMPMTIPSVVRMPRPLFATIADRAMLKDSAISGPILMSLHHQAETRDSGPLPMLR